MRTIFSRRLPQLLAALLCSSVTNAFAHEGGDHAHAPARAVNLSTRMKVEAGDNVLIGGFIIVGVGEKRVALRGLGPSLPVPGALSDPTLDLYDSTGSLVASNDNWRSNQQDELIASGLAPSHENDAALLATLASGSYTAVVRGMNDTTGVALVEVYDLDAANSTARMANLSTRGNVLTGDDVMIGGLIITGDTPKRMIARVPGPSLNLAGAPIAGRLDDPMLELRDGNGEMVAENDNWRSTQQADIEASTLPPGDDREPAVVASLAPGAYTAVVRGAHDTTGIALIEMYDLDPVPSTGGTATLYLANMRGQGTAQTGGSGTATLRLAGDETRAILFFTYAGLSSPVTSIHIHAADGTILFDPDEEPRQTDGSYIWNIRAVANYSVADILQLIKSGQTYLNVHTTNNPSGEIKGFFNFSNGSNGPPTPTPPPALSSGTPTPTDAARFLDQATFGSTAALAAKVQSEGFEAFLNEQFNAPPSLEVPFIDATGVIPPTFTQLYQAWWTHAIAAPDQLRQRVAFALSEILVVSSQTDGLGDQPIAMATYYDVLTRNAFGNFRQLLEEITLNPAMGRFLDMLRNGKADPRRKTIPNENYAREILQLFSTGVYRLNLDGSLTLDDRGFPIETYDQNAILGLSATFTGWNFAQTGTPKWFGATANYREPMISFADFHESAAKTILDGVVIPANQTAQEDLRIALDTIFNHPNVGPFISRQLIQRLVTSNPSPGYIYRVASVFNDNGQGVRGDLRAVVRAILMDYDARGPLANTQQGYGHMREPVVRVTNLLRAFNATSATSRYAVNGTTSLLQTPMRAPTVFNFFSPDYQPQGPMSDLGLKGPEFEITTDTTVVTVANYLRNIINGSMGPTENRTTINLTYEQSIAGNPAQLVDHLNALLMGGTMSPAMRTIIIDAVTKTTASNATERVRTAIYLVVNSPEYVIQK